MRQSRLFIGVIIASVIAGIAVSGFLTEFLLKTWSEERIKARSVWQTNTLETYEVILEKTQEIAAKLHQSMVGLDITGFDAVEKPPIPEFPLEVWLSSTNSISTTINEITNSIESLKEEDQRFEERIRNVSNTSKWYIGITITITLGFLAIVVAIFIAVFERRRG